MEAMLWIKPKVMAAVLAGVTVVAGGEGVAIRMAAAEPEKPAAPSPSPASSNAIDRLKPGEWLEVPDSHLDKVAFHWPKGVYFTENNLGFRGVIDCWSGGAYDTKRDRLIIWGGGHYAYGGNELYAFDVNTLKWERLTDPSLKTDKDYHAGSDCYEDGTPRSCHSYGYIQYVPSIDRFCSFGTAANFPASKGGATTWAFDFEGRKWEKKAPTAGTGFGSSSAWDPVYGRIWCRFNGSGVLAEWDPVKDAWTTRASGLTDKTWYTHSAALDPLRRRYLGVGGKWVRGYDIGKEGKIAQQELKTTGPQDVVEAGNPGFQYDPVLDKFVGWNGGADVFTLDPDKLEWEKVPPAAADAVTPTKAAPNGTYGRFRYIPSKNAYIVVNSVKENVYIYRLSDLAKQPAPRKIEEAVKSEDKALAAWAAEQVKRFGTN